MKKRRSKKSKQNNDSDPEESENYTDNLIINLSIFSKYISHSTINNTANSTERFHKESSYTKRIINFLHLQLIFYSPFYKLHFYEMDKSKSIPDLFFKLVLAKQSSYDHNILLIQKLISKLISLVLNRFKSHSNLYTKLYKLLFMINSYMQYFSSIFSCELIAIRK